MTTFKAGWRIIAAHKLYMTFYVVWLCVMMVMMSFMAVAAVDRIHGQTPPKPKTTASLAPHNASKASRDVA